MNGVIMRQFATQRAFYDPAVEFAFNADSAAPDLNHLLLLAIERALAPPVVHRRAVFQPMSIVVVDPALLSQTDRAARAEIPNVLPRALPPAPGGQQFNAGQFQKRTIRGEILSDESGRLYEKLGQQIRPIHQLASGQFGEVIDVVPTAQPTPRMIAPPVGPRAVATVSPSPKPQAESKEGGGECDSEDSTFLPLPETQQQNKPSHRKLFADPGQWRVLWWGEFKEILAPQLAHPERLKDTYRLPCYVQVLETERVVSIDELAAVYKTNNERPARLYLLNDEIAARLDLVLPLRPAPSSAGRREANTLLAHERVFRLLVANDPTIDVVNFKSNLSASPVKSDSHPLNERTVEKSAPVVSPKQIIPERYVTESAFKISREEALYDMHTKPTLGQRVRELGKRLRIFKRQQEITKWQALLAGRNADDQLWSVRPPAGMLQHQLMRDWARTTLQLAGYDAEKMLVEWEIFWRRKGF
jgi:hypothetical protein